MPSVGRVQAFGVSGLLLGPVTLIFVAGLLKSSQKYVKSQFSPNLIS